MKMIWRKAHRYFYLLCVAFSYFIYWPFFYYRSLNPKRYKSLNRLRRCWAVSVSAFAGFFYRFTFETPVDWSKTYIICPNHTSNLDIGAMCILVKSDYSFLGKQELENGLVTSLFFRTVDIPVNRDSKMSSFRAFKKAAEKLQTGVTMIIFPEGGIANDYPPHLQDFKNGPFRLAIELEIPVLPVTSSNTWELLWDNGSLHGSRPGVCRYFVHKPIQTGGLSIDDADALRNKVYGIMKQKLEADKKTAGV